MLEIDDNKLQAFEEKLNKCIVDALESKGFADNSKWTQNQWNYALTECHDRFIKQGKELRIKGRGWGECQTEYDLDKIEVLLKCYIKVCELYSREVSMMGFCKLIGCYPQTVYNWAEKSEQGNRIYQILRANNEESLANTLISRVSGQMGVVAALNHHHNWVSPLATVKEEKRNVISASELKLLLDKTDEPTKQGTVIVDDADLDKSIDELLNSVGDF